MQVDSFVDKNNECVDNRRSSDNGPSKTITELGVYEGMWMAELLLCEVEANCNHPRNCWESLCSCWKKNSGCMELLVLFKGIQRYKDFKLLCLESQTYDFRTVIS